ncbi:unnamed protein product [Bursaphelenchus xylophilus]|uniref:(pine wood nematode) hypothetical protein n=1 Tax=Bursaphelenchus xylophilus TaxID=6326 RepID=A0A1I7SLH7_BURXY|nr:unnamed protein product [Bursaphelenchus xylophilus]CAG9129603.1 unnamed protein product [Bursaphelenchus xylophilus]
MFAKLLALLVAFAMIFSMVESRPYHDASISGTLLSPWGGNLDGGYAMYQAPTYSNSVRYPYPYYYNWQK